MILAAGIGSRLKPLTITTPKPLLKINGFTMLETTIQFLKTHGIRDIIINIHHHAKQIIHYLKENDNFGVSIFISDESNELLNTGGGIVNARKYFKTTEPVLVIASDILTDISIKEMFNYHKKEKNMVTLAVKERNTSRNLLFDNNYQLAGWKNNNTGELKKVADKEFKHSLAFSGIHLIEPGFFDLVISNGAFNIIDEYLLQAKKQKIGGYEHSHTEWIEFGRISSFENAKNDRKVNRLLNELYK